jgi:predicted transcriptional regulator
MISLSKASRLDLNKLDVRCRRGMAAKAAIRALTNLGAVEAVPEAEALVPAVPIRKSITPGFLICLDDGKKFKSLKRHLASHGMTPDQYRAKWNLPKDYPMTAPDYAAKRSVLAKSIGLGQRRKDTAKRKPGRTSKVEAEIAAS